MTIAFKENDFAAIKHADEREQMIRADIEVQRMITNFAVRFEWHCALICCAQDPMAMVAILQHVVSDPEVGCTGLPPMYVRIAHREMQNRQATREAMAAATSRSATHSTQH
jgi:hypothetical protein